MLLFIQIAKVDPAVLLREIPPGLLPVRRAVPAGQNGWTLVLKLRELPRVKGDFTPLTDGRPLTPKLRNESLVALKAMEPRIALMARAVAKPGWVLPIWASPTDITSSIPEFAIYAELKNIIKALAARAELQANTGKAEAAADSLILARRISDRLLDSDGMLISHLVATAAQAIANRAAQRVAWNRRMSRAALRRLLPAFPPPGATDPHLARTYAAEFRDFFVPTIAALDALDDGGTLPGAVQTFEPGSLLAGHPNPLDKPATIRLAAAPLAMVLANTKRTWKRQVSTDAALADIRAPWPGWSTDSGAKPTPLQILQAKNRLKLTDNPFGRYLVADNVTLTNEVAVASFKRRADAGATRLTLLLALAAKSWGGRLSAALPNGVTDPFSGGAFRYDPARRIIWSVGPDGKDDGGRDTPGRWGGRDIVWSAIGRYGVRAVL